MNTKDEEYMLMLDQCRSITQAAEQLMITQPALSIFLTKLESNLGMTLFERLGKKLIPTQAGELYLNYARQIMLLKRNFELESADLKKEKKGVLRIGCINKRSIHLMPRLIRNFSSLHPEINVKLFTYHPDKLCQMLLNGELDLAYINRHYNLPELICQPIRHDHLLLVLPQNHPAAKYAVFLENAPYPYLDLRYLANETFFVLEEGFSLRYLADDAITYCKLKNPVFYTVTSIDLGCEMAAEGMGISFTTETYIMNTSYSTPRSFFFTGSMESQQSWNVIYRHTTVLPNYMNDFISLLKKEEAN